MAPRALLFFVACFLAGAGAMLGSILGNAAGKTGLFAGGVIGGILGAIASAAVARARQWIQPSQFRSTAVGAVVGFLIAAAIATNTLGSPVGPVLSTLLIGIGAVAGSLWRRSAI